MPAGCTALDFAFSIHSQLGQHCIGAKVNHKLVPMSHKLQSGDQVEILTSDSQHVQPAWINFATTAKARTQIQTELNKENREVQKRGDDLLKKWVADNGFEYSTSLIDRLSDYHGVQKPENFFLAIGNGTIKLGQKDVDELHGKNKEGNGPKGWRRYVPFLGSGKKKENDSKDVKKDEKLTVGANFNKKRAVIITPENIKQYVFPSCCHPIPGDDILGFIDNKGHIEIHQRACSVASKLKSSYGNRLVDAKWDMRKQMFFDATISIQGIDRKGLLLDVSKVISAQLGINIHKITISSDNGIFEGHIELRVHDRDEVKFIMDKLKGVTDLQEIQQIE